MPYPSVDALQNILAEQVFDYTIDRKKASGRALGTLVEIIAYYLLRSWGFRDSIAIERPLAEYKNPDISHNVEYSLHPILQQWELEFSLKRLPITAAKIRSALWQQHTRADETSDKANQLLSGDGVLRNCCTVATSPIGPFIAHLEDYNDTSCSVSVSNLRKHPYAIFECKRVGIEEGSKKGPQTIEKAKQGAYVARTVSCLQKIRLADGRMGGLIHKNDGTHKLGVYSDLLRKIIESSDAELLRDFILTVGVVSNHGNWFTSDNPNKELKVLAQSYDWLIFLTDEGLAQFINELLLDPVEELLPARDAFLASYTLNKKRNRFTKVQMDIDADAVLQNYFEIHKDKIESWFNVISPEGRSLALLRDELTTLANKNWKRMLNL